MPWNHCCLRIFRFTRIDSAMICENYKEFENYVYTSWLYRRKLGEERRHGFITRDHKSRNHRELRKFLAAKVLKILSQPDNKDLLGTRVQKVAVEPQFSLRPKVSRSKLGNCYRHVDEANRTSSHRRGVYETKTKLQDTIEWKTIDL